MSLSSSFLALPRCHSQEIKSAIFIYSFVSPASAERKTNKSQDGQRSENETVQGISDRMSLGKTRTYRMQTSAEAEVPSRWICFVGTLWKYMKRQKSNNFTFWDTLMFLLLWDYFFYCSFHLHQPPSLLQFNRINKTPSVAECNTKKSDILDQQFRDLLRFLMFAPSVTSFMLGPLKANITEVSLSHKREGKKNSCQIHPLKFN